jgi:hypothetical protein
MRNGSGRRHGNGLTLDRNERREADMGIWAWLALLLGAAAIATIGQLLLFRKDRGPADYDWVYMAGGALLGGFTGHAWYPVGPTVDGLYVVPAALCALVGAAVLEVVYRLLLRPRQTHG